MDSQLQILAVSTASLLCRLLETKFTVLDSPTSIHCTFSGSASPELCAKVTTVSKLRVTYIDFFLMMKICVCSQINHLNYFQVYSSGTYICIIVQPVSRSVF